MGLQFSPFESFIGANSQWAADIFSSPCHHLEIVETRPQDYIGIDLFLRSSAKLFSHLISIWRLGLYNLGIVDSGG